MSKRKYKDFFEMCSNGDSESDNSILNLYFVSLISSENVWNVESCDESIHELVEMKQQLLESDTTEEFKSQWLERIEKGIQICEEDKKRFIYESSEEYIEKKRKEKEEARIRREKIKLTEDDITWQPLYPNNMPDNGLEGYYTLVFRKDKEEKIRGVKYTIEFQKEEKEPGVQMWNAPIEYYILYVQEYEEVKGRLSYPEPSNEDDVWGEGEETFCSSGVNDYGSFIRAYSNIEDAKTGALARMEWRGVNKETLLRNV